MADDSALSSVDDHRYTVVLYALVCRKRRRTWKLCVQTKAPRRRSLRYVNLADEVSINFTPINHSLPVYVSLYTCSPAAYSRSSFRVKSSSGRFEVKIKITVW